ncbi:uncharacterized protein LOC130413131 [Triplophysa dalaica]|uniref:uncharacterized protein LOC130413131 n=1 Tax=Triplophysa dalaica TaxID=1582913 RepID=UPI0024DFC7BE|nr:uncharacterized protein LOC130413131 [Triplophysa dalaica]
MTDSQHLTDSAQTRVKELCPTDGIRKKGILIEDGNPARYRLETTIDHIDESESHRKIIFGERDTKKPHKTFLIVGETGTGKTTLINTMINYTCGVQREDKIWIEITDDQSDRTSAHSQTSIITVYGVYIPESSVDLTIIDTPGYGDTRGTGHDKEIGRSLQHVGTSDDVAYGTSAVCFVIKADQNRLTDRQQYIFDAVQCLFGKDIEENIVLLFTHSTGARPKNALTAVKEAKIKCAVDEKKQPIYFLFNNCQSEAFDEEDQTMQDHLWDLSYKGMTGLFKFLDTVRPKNLQMTKDVLQKRKQLEANISNLQSRVQEIEIKHTELKQTEEALEKQNQYFQDNKNFEFTVEVPYKEMVDIDPAVAGKAMCCTVCEENCHYPDYLVIDKTFSKSELLVVPSHPSIEHHLTLELRSSTITPIKYARNLGVMFDDQLQFNSYIAATTGTYRYVLYNIRKIRPFLAEHASQLLVQTLVISRLDYCNSLLPGLPINAVKPLQMIQHAVAGLVFNQP